MKPRRRIIATVAALAIGATPVAQITPAWAQAEFNATQRAKQAGETNRLRDGGAVFRNSTVGEVVTPYAGTNVPEANIDEDNIESRMNERVLGGSTESRAHRQMMDSVTLRPSYNLDADYFGIGIADDVDRNAEAIAGRFFSAEETENPACNYEGFSAVEPFTRYCDAFAQVNEMTCRIDRVVDVERRDVWSCDRAWEEERVRCAVGADGACAPEGLPENDETRSCTLTGERCVEWVEPTVREPSAGYRLEHDRYGWNYYSYNVVWNGVVVGVTTCQTGMSMCTFLTSSGNCSYYRTETFVGEMFGVYRVCTQPPRCVAQERDYSCMAEDQCVGLREASACRQTANRCLTTNATGCIEDRSEFECSNDMTVYAGAALRESRIESIEDTLVNRCRPDPATLECEAGQSVCTAGPETRTIMGFPVARDCWSYSQDFTCVDGGSRDTRDCRPFLQDATCEMIEQTCLSTDDGLPDANGECRHWEYGYRCGGGMQFPEQCAAVNVCVGELCEGIVDEPDQNFAMASSWLSMLDEAAKDNEKRLDMTDVRIFDGRARSCGVGILSSFNCCKDSGWANGIFTDCSERELELMDRVEADAAEKVGTYCSRRVLGVCLEKRRVYCTFNSQLAAVFQSEARRIAGEDFGSAQNPNCQGLTLSELEELDWDQIDLSPAFEKMVNKADVPNPDYVRDTMRNRLENLTP